jgi:hypothetical protein
MSSQLQQVILRRIDDTGPSSADVASHLDAAPGVSVLDKNPGSLLVEGDAGSIAAVAKVLNGWRSFPVARIPVPDTRQKILKPAP